MGRRKVTPPDPRRAEKEGLLADVYWANPQAPEREVTRIRNLILRHGWTLTDLQQMSLPDLRTVAGLGQVGALMVYRYAQQTGRKDRP